jgi:hypothetical protein
MAVQPGIASSFAAVLEDNGNAIDLPSGSSFAWSTDDPTDQIAVSDDTLTASITVSSPPASGRTTITVTADTTAPDGSDVSGSVTTDIVPGVTHTYTVSVSQVSTTRRVPKR